MDERKNRIKNLEAKKQADIKTRERLLEGLGEAVFKRIGDGNPFDDTTGDTPGGVLAEFRGLQKEIDSSVESIASLEKEVLRLKELEDAISAKEDEQLQLEKDIEGVYGKVGKNLLSDPDFREASGELRQQEENLLDRISEHETKLTDLDRRDGNIFAWLGKNAQMTLSKTLLSKNRLALSRLYRAAGEKFFASGQTDSLSGENADAVGKALDLKERLASLSADLTELRGERRKIGDLFGTDGSPSRRILSLKKYIEQTREKFPTVYLRMGSLAVMDGGRALLSSFLRSEDEPALEQAGSLKADIDSGEREIAKIKAAINIDGEKAEIEKLKQSINAQRQKIAAAEEAIAGIEKQISETERHIEELRAFIDSGDSV